MVLEIAVFAIGIYLILRFLRATRGSGVIRGHPRRRVARCGDGQVMLPELCDDANQVNDDGWLVWVGEGTGVQLTQLERNLGAAGAVLSSFELLRYFSTSVPWCVVPACSATVMPTRLV